MWTLEARIRLANRVPVGESVEEVYVDSDGNL
jgi:hypothetical protein